MLDNARHILIGTEMCGAVGLEYSRYALETRSGFDNLHDLYQSNVICALRFLWLWPMRPSLPAVVCAVVLRPAAVGRGNPRALLARTARVSSGSEHAHPRFHKHLTAPLRVRHL